ncbi:translation initiation factor IF-3 [Pontibacter sp. G13]|uniref:translation initiation factor IF-3 n=1 Tax=Pontibacter sp. G13 TaxID=3074898 RepID=UPI00288A7CE6|nr:translation initiation factor IF-3 [Pontibacter sp. G13]WNJ21016.1 translation initiation factor IF-3 [Pontibacter sp. G13]
MAKRRRRAPRNMRVDTREHRINHEIRVPEVRLTGLGQYREELGEREDGVYATQDALRMANELNLDLVEVAAKAIPPVCRIVEYSKFRYEQKKREKANKAKQHTVVMKEIRFGPNTDEHDFQFKLRHAQKFLEEGNKLKAYVQFRGRNIIYKNRGRDMLDKFAEELDELAKIEMAPKMEGRRMIMIMAPRKGANT